MADCGQVDAEPVAAESNVKTAAAADTTTADTTTETAPTEPSIANEEPPRLPPPKNAVAMPKPHRVWVDKKQGVVFVDGYVSLNEGLLEMFACPSGTKEHESVVAVYCSAQMVHTGLLLVGAKPGHPVRWDPKFEPPTGTEISIEVRWLDEAKKWQKIDARQWLIDAKTEKTMTHPWVFAGSGFWKDEESGREYYLAESGDLVCVSNFSSATLDIPAPSSAVNDGLMFAANTKKIPPIGTPVRLVFKPKLKKDIKQPPPTNQQK